MSITQDLKGYADAAVETGRSVINDGFAQSRTAVNERLTQLRSTLDDGIDGAGERAGKLAETVTGTGTQAIDQARISAYATVGTVDTVVTTVVTRLQEFPSDVAGAVAKTQTAATDAAEKVLTGVSKVVGKAGDAVQEVRPANLRSQAQSAADAYATKLQERRVDLAARGEAVVTDLRNDPRVVRVASLVGAATDTVEQVAAKPARSRAAEKAQATRAHNERSARAKKAANTRARKSATTATPRKRTARTTTTTATPTKATKATS